MPKLDNQGVVNASSTFSKSLILAIAFALSIGVTVYAGKAAIGNMYVLSLKSEIQGIESLLDKGVTPSVIDAKQLANSVLLWDGNTPSTQTYVASFVRWFNHLMEGKQPSEVGQVLSLNALEALNCAIEQRPTMANQYVYKATELWHQGATKSQIAEQIALAQQFGPYEQHVALASLEFYLAFWPSLETAEKIQASQYLLSPRKYRLSYRKIGKVVNRSVHKQKACNLLKFNKVKIRECNV